MMQAGSCLTASRCAIYEAGETMKQFDSRNIDKRAERLLRYHAGLLMEKGIPMVKENENYYIYDQNKEDYMKMVITILHQRKLNSTLKI